MKSNGKNDEKVELWNILHERDVVTLERTRMRMPVRPNSDATCTAIPKEVAERLDLLYGGLVCVRYADGRVAMRRVARGLCLRVTGMGGRLITTDAVIEPDGDAVLLGSNEVNRMGPVARIDDGR